MGVFAARAGHADGDLIIVDLRDGFTALMLGTPPVSDDVGLSNSRARQSGLSTRCSPGPSRTARPWLRRSPRSGYRSSCAQTGETGCRLHVHKAEHEPELMVLNRLLRGERI